MRTPEGRNYQESRREPDLRNILVSLNRTFTTLEHHLRLPHDDRHRRTVEGSFRGSPKKIVIIGVIEENLGNTDKPLYTTYFDRWHEDYIIAIEKGYTVKTFEEYLKGKKK